MRENISDSYRIAEKSFNLPFCSRSTTVPSCETAEGGGGEREREREREIRNKISPAVSKPDHRGAENGKWRIDFHIQQMDLPCGSLPVHFDFAYTKKRK